MLNNTEIVVEVNLKNETKLISVIYDIHTFQNLEAGPLGNPVIMIKSILLLFNPFENLLQWFPLEKCKILSIDKTPDKRRIIDESGKL